MDIVLAIVPRIEDDFGYTPAGAALLKGMVTKHGYTAKVMDLNADLEHLLEHDQPMLKSVSNYFLNIDFYSARVFQKVHEIMQAWAQQICEINPRWLGISIFSYNSQRAARLLAACVKRLRPEIKIVIGGAGIVQDHDYCRTLADLRLIDAYVQGEGELALIEVLRGNLCYPGVNGTPARQIDDLDRIPYPDYTDYEMASYVNRKGLVALPITGSRGCVRACTFCDIALQWPRYRFRSGASIANEMQHQIATYGVRSFRFTDSLINGSMKAFKEMITTLAHYRHSLPEHARFSWDSHFIIRGPREMPPAMFDTMAHSGANVMLVGVESGSQAVRDHMKKGFTQAELDYCMQQFSRVGIKTRFLIIVGYPTETRQDFQATMDMFSTYKPYCDDGTIEEVNLGLTLNLLPGTPLSDNLEANGIIQANNHINDWVCVTNPELDYKERLRRRIILQEHVESLGYRVFEAKNYTKALFLAWSEVSKMPQDAKKIMIERARFDRERGILIEETTAKTIAFA